MSKDILIGTSDFGKIIKSGSLFIDKSFLISKILHGSFEIVLLTRPRRFGKSLNMSMLYYFLSPDVNGQETKGLFDSLSIANTPDFELQGKSQVIFLTFQGIKFKTWSKSFNIIKERISNIFLTKQYLLESEKIHKNLKDKFNGILNETLGEEYFATSLHLLSHMIYLHHGVRPWILMDEYDAPILSAAENGYYDEMLGFMRPFFEITFKDNSYLEKGVITGVLRLAKEGLFSGLNNLQVYSVLSNEFTTAFGFTETEVNQLLTERMMMLPKIQEIVKTWYNGYLFGKDVIYNPWSVLNFLQTQQAHPYWVNTSNNFLIKELIGKADFNCHEKLFHLLQGKSLIVPICDQVSFNFLRKDLYSIHQEDLWILLVSAGYLKSNEFNGKTARIAIPNLEIKEVLERMVLEWISNDQGTSWSQDFIQKLIHNRVEEFTAQLERVLLSTVSFFDPGMQQEAFYHGLMLGLLVALESTYEVLSNRESGYGRYDILLKSKIPNTPSIIFELKVAQKSTLKDLKLAAKQALAQISKNKYTIDLDDHKVIHVGLGFKGKKLFILTKNEIF